MAASATPFERFPLRAARGRLVAGIEALGPPVFDVYAGVDAEDFSSLGSHLDAVADTFDAYLAAVAEEASAHVTEITIDPAEHLSTVRAGTFDDLRGLIREEAERRASGWLDAPGAEHRLAAGELGLRRRRPA